MYILYCDETNADGAAGNFFIYGGIIIPFENALEYSKVLQSIRDETGIPKNFSLKFKPCPEQIRHDQFNQVKQQYVEAAIKYGSKILLSMVHCRIVKNGDFKEAGRNELNRILYHFDCYLKQHKDHGIVLIDRFGQKATDDHVRTKMHTGLLGMPFGTMELEKIVGIHYSAIGQSHFTSLIDIIIGTIRYCTTAITKEKTRELKVANKLVQFLEPLCIRDPMNGKVSELSIFFSPREIIAPTYRNDYIRVRKFLESNGIEPIQKIIAK